MRHFLVASMVGMAVLMLGGCASKGSVKPGSKLTVVKQGFNTVVLRKYIDQDPTEEDIQTLVQQGRSALQHSIQTKSEQEIASVLRHQPQVIRQVLEKMKWQPLHFKPPVMVVRKDYSSTSSSLEVQVEIDRIAWLKQLKAQLKTLDHTLDQFKRVPDQVSALLKLRAMVPALPLLLHRIQVRKMIWRLASDSAVSKQDRMAEKFMYELHQTSQGLVFEVDTDIEKKPVFEQALEIALLELGFKQLATRPADIFVFYEIQNHQVVRRNEGVKVTYSLSLKLSDESGTPFAIYPLEVAEYGSTQQIATMRIMQKIADDIQDKVAEYLLKEYRVLYLRKGHSL